MAYEEKATLRNGSWPLMGVLDLSFVFYIVVSPGLKERILQ